jgi:D-amino-acid dehydrogenase
MEHAMRLAGTVELADAYAPPNEARAHILGNHARSLFPSMTWTHGSMWMGHRPALPDSIPVIGAVPKIPRLFIATGHGHYGVVGAPATGQLLAELVSGRPPHIDPRPFDPTRFE